MDVGRDLESASGGDPSSPGRTPTVGKYQLLAVLGRGGMADVFLALSRGPMGFNKLTVVKRLRAGLADDNSFRDMFLDEARLAARLNHPNVVHTYEVGEHDGVYFIAMEYLEGQSLNKVIKEAQKRDISFDLAFCARVVSDALAGLHHAHTLKDYDGTPLRIIHRDVSPHNVFVTYDGSIKLVDFGIAKAALSSVETEVGVLKGKVAYMSPEQATSQPIDARSDIFAMGIVLWELLAKTRLMTGDSAAGTLHRLVNQPIPRVSSVRPDVDPVLDDIIARSLEKDPADRYQTAQDMRDALEAYIADMGKSIRQDDIGRRVSAMFHKIREDIQRQIQTHMEGVTQVPFAPSEVATLTQDSIKAIPKGASGQLPTLNVGSGSGSGVVSNLSAPGPLGQSFPPMPTDPRAAPTVRSGDSDRKAGLALWLVLALSLGLVAVAALGFRKEPWGAGPVVGTGTAPQPTTAFTNPGTSTGGAPVPAGQGVVAGSSTDKASDVPPPTPPTQRPKWASSAQGHHTTGKGATPAPPPSAPAAEDESEIGYLTFDTYPWTKVSENGKALGTTPIVHVALTAGPHTLTLENPDQGIKQSYSITIKGGDTVSRRLGLK